MFSPDNVQKNYLGDYAQTMAGVAMQKVYDSTGGVGLLNSALGSQMAPVSSLPSQVTDFAGSAVEQDINLGHGIVVAMGTGVPAGLYNLRSLIAWVVVITLLIVNYRTEISEIHKVMFTPQAQGPDTGTIVDAFGGNIATATICAGLILTFVAAIPTLLIGFFTNELSFMSSQTSAMSTLGGALVWGYNFLSQFIPIAVIVSAFTTRAVFVVAAETIGAVTAMFVKMLVGV
jgi:hypothetical protein